MKTDSYCHICQRHCRQLCTFQQRYCRLRSSRGCTIRIHAVGENDDCQYTL